MVFSLFGYFIMGHLVGLNDIHLTCSKDLDCNTKIVNSYCDRNITCSCERGYRYYSKFNKCIFSNHFNCNSVQQCASLDPRLTCVDNYCTCNNRSLRTDNYLCSNFRKYCYKGYRYNVETTDCIFIGDLKVNQLESLDQSVEIFVIVLFFITSALFIASCLNNYQNERREKLRIARLRIAQQQTMSLFAEQRRRMSPSSITEVINLENDNLYANHNQNGTSRYNSTGNQNRHFRYQDTAMMNYHNQLSKPIVYEDMPPSYDECMKNEDLKFYSTTVPFSNQILNQMSNNIENQINQIIEHQNQNHQDRQNHTDNLVNFNLIDNNTSLIPPQSELSIISTTPNGCILDNQMGNVPMNASNELNNTNDLNKATTNDKMHNGMCNIVNNRSDNLENSLAASNNDLSANNACHLNDATNDSNNNLTNCK